MDKRRGDDPNYDPSSERVFRGLGDPRDYINGNEVMLGWGDRGARIRGSITIVITVMALSLGGIIGAVVYNMIEIRRLLNEDHRRILVEQETQSNKVLEQVKALLNEQRVTSYLLSLPPEERTPLIMPEGLQGRLAPPLRDRKRP